MDDQVLLELCNKSLNHDKEKGIILWKDRPTVFSRVVIGYEAGYLHHTGYRYVNIKNRRYSTHRIIWLMSYRSLPTYPSFEIDHINGDKSDNRLCNLRCATKSQNMANTSLLKSNTSGYRGVNMNHGKWVAAIKINKKKVHLGVFLEKEDAAKAYNKAALEFFGEYAYQNVVTV